MEPNKCNDIQWCDINDLPNNTIPFVKHALDQIFFLNKSYSEYGWGEEE